MQFIRRMPAVLALALASGSALAAPADMARQFADEFAVPRFRAVAEAAHAQDTAWATFCANPKRGEIKNLKGAYETLADTWSDVEFVHIGPAAAALRVERFNWWLDRTDARAKALTAMLAAKPQDLVP